MTTDAPPQDIRSDDVYVRVGGAAELTQVAGDTVQVAGDMVQEADDAEVGHVVDPHAVVAPVDGDEEVAVAVVKTAVVPVTDGAVVALMDGDKEVEPNAENTAVEVDADTPFVVNPSEHQGGAELEGLAITETKTRVSALLRSMLTKSLDRRPVGRAKNRGKGAA